MTGTIEHAEMITKVQRRQRRKAAIIEETCSPGMSVSLVAP